MNVIQATRTDRSPGPRDHAAGNAAPETAFADALGAADKLDLAAKRPFDPGEPLLPTGNFEDALRAGLAELQAALGQVAKEAGVRTPPPIGLGIGRDGSLTIDAHPQREQLAAALAERPGIRNAVARNIGLKQLIEAGREAIAFQRAYAEDPQAAIARFSHLFGGQAPKQPKLLFALGPDGPALAFASAMRAFRPPLFP